MKATTGPPTQYAIKIRDPGKNSEAGNNMEEATAAETIGT
jgi:hypothetical protein